MAQMPQITDFTNNPLATIALVVVVGIVTQLAPKWYERFLQRRRDDASVFETQTSASISLTDAALGMVDRHEVEIARLSEDIASLKQLVKARSDEIARLKSEAAQLRAQITELQRREDVHVSRIQQLETELAEAERKIEALMNGEEVDDG